MSSAGSITNDERRHVAGKLREYASWDDEGSLVDRTDWGESVLNLLDCGDTEGECYAALADLIDPGDTSQGCRDTCAVESSHRVWGEDETWYEVKLSCGDSFPWWDSCPPDFCPYCGCGVITDAD